MTRILILLSVLFLAFNSKGQYIITGSVTSNDFLNDIVPDATVQPSYSSSMGNSPAVPYTLDIDKNGSPDFTFTGDITQIGMGGSFVHKYITTSGIAEVAASVKSCTWSNGPSQPINTVTKVVATGFNPGDTINSSLSWFSGTVYTDHYDQPGPFGGCELRTGTSYIGVRVFCGGNYQYGWIKYAGGSILEICAIEKSTCNNPFGIGIKEYEKQGQFQLYPNPAQNTLSIKLGEENSPISISIIDVTGKTIIDDKIIGNDEHLNISMISEGIYTVKIRNRGYTIYKKLVKE